MDKLEAIRKSSIFQNLDASEIETVLRYARERDARRDEVFFLQGDVPAYFYVLGTGRVKLTRLTAGGDQIILRFVCPGQPFGGISVLSGDPYPVSAEAMMDSTAVYWEGEGMKSLMQRFPQITFNFVTILGDQVRELQDRYVELSTERVERRVARTLIRLTRSVGRRVSTGILIDIALTRQDLAEMTGTTLYTVSRILSRWEEKGIVRSEREKIMITYPHGLVVIAEDLQDVRPAEKIQSEISCV